MFFPHGLSHYLVGSLVGIRFRYYFLGRSGIRKLKLPLARLIASRVPVLVLKVDWDSLQSVSPGKRAVMFASGALASVILPFFAAVASLRHLPVSMSMLLFIISVASVLFELYYSPRAGDLSRLGRNPSGS